MLTAGQTARQQAQAHQAQANQAQWAPCYAQQQGAVWSSSWPVRASMKRKRLQCKNLFMVPKNANTSIDLRVCLACLKVTLGRGDLVAAAGAERRGYARARSLGS